MAKTRTSWGPGNPPPGRGKGNRNRKTKVAEEFAQSFLKEPEVQAAILSVIQDPKHEHWRWTVELMHHYAYGKPIERSESKSDHDITQRGVISEIVDFREVAFEENGQRNGHTPSV